jgi:hypothetical protein
MSERTGLGDLQVTVISALASLGAVPDAPRKRNHRVLTSLCGEQGGDARYLWTVLRDLARPWRMPYPLISFHGSSQAGDVEPLVDARFSESRLTRLGYFLLGCELDGAEAVPFGFISGTMYTGGIRPPLDPSRVARTFRALMADPGLADREILELIGQPSFAQSCEIEGDVMGLMRGRDVVLSLSPRAMVRKSDQGVAIELAEFPPELWADEVVAGLRRYYLPDTWMEGTYGERRRPAIANVVDATGPTRVAHENERVIIELESNGSPGEVLAQLRRGLDDTRPHLRDDSSIVCEVEAGFGGSVPNLVRAWLEKFRLVTSDRALAALADCFA